MDEPRTVIEAIAAVMGELPAISKGDRASDQQGGYSYRGIESITSHLQPLLAKNGLVFVPKVVGREVREISVGNPPKPWTDTILTVRYRCWFSNDQKADLGPGVPGHDYIDVGPVVGIGRDGADKGANKAMSQAFKYALLQTFMISDKADDGDSVNVEADRPEPEPTPAQKLASRAHSLPEPQRVLLRAWCSERRIPNVPAQMTADQIVAVNAYLDSTADQPILPEANQPQTETVHAPALEPEPPSLEETVALDVIAMSLPDVRYQLESRSLLTAGSGQVLRDRLIKTLIAERSTTVPQEAATVGDNG